MKWNILNTKIFANDRYGMEKKIYLDAFMNSCIIEFSIVSAGMIDGIIVSRMMGETAMAALGFAYPIFSIIGVFCGMFSVGMQVCCSEELGLGNKKGFNRFFSGIFYLAMIIAVVVTAIIIIFPTNITLMLGARKGTLMSKYVSDYIIGVGPSAIFIFVISLLNPVITLDNGKKLVGKGALIQTVSNIVLDLLAVKFNLGIAGIGYATSVSKFLNAIFLFGHFFKKNRMLKFTKELLTLKEYSHVMLLGSGVVLKRLGNILRPLVVNRLIIFYGGTIAMSALSIRSNFGHFALISTNGLAEALILLIGIYFGEKNDEMIEVLYKFANKFGFVLSCAISVLLVFFAKPIMQIYAVRDPELEMFVIFSIWMLALYIPIDLIVNLRIKYLEAVHKIINMQIYSFATSAVFVSISAFICGKLYGVHGILSAIVVGDLLALLCVYFFYAIKYRTFFPRMKDFLDLPKDFHVKPQDVISLDVRNIEDASLVSEQISLFCRGHKIDKKITYYAALAFEELSINTITHGFPKNKVETPYIDVRVVINKRALTIRMKDNCSYFDTVKALNENNDNDSPEKIGLKMIRSCAKKISYSNYLDTNITIMEF